MYTVTALVACSVGACLGFVIAGLCAIQKDPAASRLPLPDAGGSWAGFDLPGSLAFASPLAGPAPPSGHHSPDVVWAMGRGMNDFKCADSVAVTIEGDKVWLEVDGVNVFRAKNIGLVQVDDRRVG
jgi:hypothetical protein